MISVIIPTYNSARTITSTLDSVGNQTFRDYEVLITDDESSDSTVDLCREYANDHPQMRITIDSISHSGVAAARNRALAQAAGDYFAFLDSDDRWMPEKLENVVALIRRCPRAGLIYHDAVIVALDGRRSPKFCGPPPQDPYRRLLLGDNFLLTSSVTVQRSSIARAGGFDCNPNFEICEDYELWLRLASTGARFAHVPAPLVEIVRTEGSLSSNISRHMRNRLHVRRHCLRHAVAAGVLSLTEFKGQVLRLTALQQATIARNELRQRHPTAAIRAAAVAVTACFRLVLAGDWSVLRRLVVVAAQHSISSSSAILRRRWSAESSVRTNINLELNS